MLIRMIYKNKNTLKKEEEKKDSIYIKHSGYSLNNILFFKYTL